MVERGVAPNIAPEVVVNYEDHIIQKNNDGLQTFLEAADYLKNVDKKTRDDLGASAMPLKYANQVMRSTMLPQVVKANQEQLSARWKRLFFLNGRGIKEGTNLYSLGTVKQSWENIKPLLTHKDFTKAYLMWKCTKEAYYPPGATNHGYVSSKGFSKCLLGKVQKAKRYRQKIIRKAEKYSKMSF